ncbi:MAG: magnesium transporter, partial [Bacteroidetes bacterium]
MPFELSKDFIDEIKASIEDKDENTSIEILESLHPADIAEIYDELSIDEAKFLYLLLDK